MCVRVYVCIKTISLTMADQEPNKNDHRNSIDELSQLLGECVSKMKFKAGKRGILLNP